ncbi:Lysophospholipase L1 [Geodermatophilus dictyosporus]|uniref:Lysophospholipase L1 n=1 Tax=Geodermatophilus dictyosporus TaxID=1523247 RepID=A0A1I5LCB1_9ACTN|nr:SGNH/GDSL hydrolase family protein [Geodermatophilus dictyosporus]SFO94351.1 Lysophospholipase L1 [Geodermatophilus dictyosporus]
MTVLAAGLAVAACGGTAGPDRAAAEVRAVFLGDSYTVGVGTSVGPTYAARTADRLGWTEVDAGQSGTGYVADGGGGDRAPFRARVPDVAQAAPDVVVVQGSTNDAGVPSVEVGAAATALYADLAAAVPGARVVVLGPLAAPGVPRAEIEAIRDALAAAAAQAGLLFVDPVAGDWLAPSQGLWADSTHPDDEGYAVVADELVAALEAAGL